MRAGRSPAGGQLALLAREIGVEESHPFFVFLQAGLLDVPQRGMALSNLAWVSCEPLLRQLEIESGYFARGIQFADIADFLLHVQPDLLALVAQLQVRNLQLALGQPNICPRS